MKLTSIKVAVLCALGATAASSQAQGGPISPACTASPGTAPPSAPTPAFAGTSRVALTAGAASVSNNWASAGQTRFHHIIAGPAGKVRLTLETCSSASGGETVALYPATASGERVPRKPRVMFAIAVRNGNVRHANATIPAGKGATPGALNLVVVVENASGRFHQGAYRLTVTR